MRRLISIAALCAIAAVVVGCASPPARFYTLSATTIPASPPALRTADLSVFVDAVSIPALVDRPQVVVRAGMNQVSFDEFNRWAMPLADDISRVVSIDLMAILGTPRVSRAQQSLNTEADYRVTIDVQSFESVLGQEATLYAAWTVRRTLGGKTQSGRTGVHEPVNGNGFDALAAAHSHAVARLSRDIADTISLLHNAIP